MTMSLARTEQSRAERRRARPRVAATTEEIVQARMFARQDATTLQEAMRVVEMAHRDWPEDRENEPARRLFADVLWGMRRLLQQIREGGATGTVLSGWPAELAAAKRLADACHAYGPMIAMGVPPFELAMADLGQAIRTQSAALQALVERGDQAVASQAEFAAGEISAALRRFQQA